MRNSAATLWYDGFSARFLPFSFKILFIAFGLVLDVSQPACAETSPSERATDDVLALRVQAAIASDPILQPLQLNLLVNLVDGMAVIAGEIPEMHFTRRIDTVARGVPGIRGVKISCWESPKARTDPFTRRVQEHVQRPDELPALPAPKPKPLPDPPLTILSQPFDDKDRSRPVVTPRPSTSRGTHLLDPVNVSSPRSTSPGTPYPGSAPLPYETIPPTSVPTKPIIVEDGAWQPIQPSGHWQSIRDRDSRFSGLQVMKTGTGLTVIGSAHHLQDAWDFAEKLQILTGVDTVVVGKIQIVSKK